MSKLTRSEYAQDIADWLRCLASEGKWDSPGALARYAADHIEQDIPTLLQEDSA